MKLTTTQRKKLPTSDFALEGRRYPLNNASHARNALARVSQFGSPSEQATVRAKVHAKFPSIGKAKKKLSLPKPSLANRLTAMRAKGAFGKKPGRASYGAGID